MPLNPGETEAEALKRQIKMHEFLMSGGIAEGRDANGNIVYGDPISVTDLPEDCPFHSGTHCAAWVEIYEGRGQWTKLELELSLLETEYDDLITKTGVFDGADVARSNELKFEILSLEQKLAERPVDAKQLRENPTVYAAAPNKHKPGNPWDQQKVHRPIESWKNGVAYDSYGEVIPSGGGYSGYQPPKKTSERDARNVVDAAAASLSEQEDTITFENGEDEEDE